jgi:zinc transporter ZupT
MDFFSRKYLIWATTLGAISAASLPLGSVVGLRTNPKPVLISSLAAFGAGALIAALAVELVAPTVFALGSGSEGDHGENPITNFYSLLSGAILGGILFVMLDQLVNAKGGFCEKVPQVLPISARQKGKEKRRWWSDYPGCPCSGISLRNISTRWYLWCGPIHIMTGSTLRKKDMISKNFFYSERFGGNIQGRPGIC